LPPAVVGVDAIVHFAGVLFKPRPERFLPETNTRWFSNLLTAALEAKVGRGAQSLSQTASTSIVIDTVSPTTTPPLSIVSFHLTPKS
jgi:hypothetical protein